jgi:uncharacterized RDD family membrane protein YckC
MSDIELSEEKTKGQFTTKFLIIFAATLIISSVGIFASAIYFFTSPGIVSGIVFGLAILLLFIGPLVFAIVYYFKKWRTKDEDEEEKEIIELQRVED